MHWNIIRYYYITTINYSYSSSLTQVGHFDLFVFATIIRCAIDKLILRYLCCTFVHFSRSRIIAAVEVLAIYIFTPGLKTF